MEMWNAQPTGAPPPPPTLLPPWQAPTDVEQRLYEAKSRGDWAAYFDALADTELFMWMPRLQADGHPTGPDPKYWSPAVGQWCEVVTTEGMLPAPTPDIVYFHLPLKDLAKAWEGNDEWLAVNPGTPCEAFFPPDAARWKQHARRGKGMHSATGTLRTLRVGSPIQGPVAHGLGCGAMLSVTNGLLWNAMGFHGCGYSEEQEKLKEWWGVADRTGWQRMLGRLLDGEVIGGDWEFVLKVRQSLAGQHGGPADPATWREAAEHVLRSAVAEQGRTVPDNEIADLHQLIGRIVRYESRFRADGLLAPGACTSSVLAWDYGRAANMARWGLAARYADLAEAEQAVLRVSRLSQATYASWDDFAAGYVLGRCLHFDKEHFGSWYKEMLDAHRVLKTHPESPWLTVPWR
jgi:hypothetical protein